MSGGKEVKMIWKKDEEQPTASGCTSSICSPQACT